MKNQSHEGPSQTGGLLPGSGFENVGATTNSDLEASMSSQFHASFLGISEPSQANGKDTVALPEVASKASNDSIPVVEQTTLFDGLRASLQRKESLKEGVPDFSIIESAIKENPRMMANLRRLQRMGAQLVITNVDQTGVVFADAAQNLDIQKQEAGLAGLTEEERNGAIETILTSISDDEKSSARAWLLSQLSRSDDARGLNYVEALVYAVAHGGSLITYDVYDKIAKRDPSVSENMTWTWYFKTLSDVMSSGALGGSRDSGVADTGRSTDSGRRGAIRGGRVAELRVEIA